MGNQFRTLSLLLVIVCVCVSFITTKLNPKEAIVPPSDSNLASSIPIEIHGVKILRQPSDTKLAQLGVASWPKWEGTPSKFPWTFKKTETMYFVEGKIKVNVVDGYDKEEDFFEIGKGDVVVFPKGMTVVWEITEDVKKHYSLEE